MKMLDRLIEGWHDYQFAQKRLYEINRRWLEPRAPVEPLRWRHDVVHGWTLTGDYLPDE